MIMCMIMAVSRRGGAALAIHPARVAIFVVLFLPDRDAMFDFVDDVSTRAECLVAMTRADAYPYRHVADREITDAVYACGVFDAKPRYCFGNNAFAFLHRKRLERLIFQVSDAKPFIVIPDESLECGIAAAGGVGKL